MPIGARAVGFGMTNYIKKTGDTIASLWQEEDGYGLSKTSTYVIRKIGDTYYAIKGGKDWFHDDDPKTVIEKVLNDSPRYNKSVKLVGDGAISWNFSDGLTFPTLQNYLFDAKDITFTLAEGKTLRIDSIMDTKLIFGVITQTPATDTPAVLIKPEGDSEIISAGEVKAVIDSEIEISSIAGGSSPYPSASVGLKIDCSLGDFTHTKLKVRNVHGFKTAIYMPNPATGRLNVENEFDFLRAYECSKCMQIGDAGSTPRIFGNKGRIVHIQPDSGGDGLEFAMSNDIWECLFWDNVASGKAIILDDVTENLLIFASTRIKDFGITDNSTAKTSKVLTVQELIESEWASQFTLCRGAGSEITGNSGANYATLTCSRLRSFPEHFWNHNSLKEVWLEVGWNPQTTSGGLRLYNDTDGTVIETLEPGAAGFRYDYEDITSDWKSLMASGKVCVVQTKGDGATAPTIEFVELRMVAKIG